MQIIVTTVMFLVVFGWFGLILIRKKFSKTQINRKTLLFLSILTILFFIVNIGFNSFRAADEEWTSIYRAKTMLDGNKRIYSNDNTGIVFPLIVANLLKISHFHYPIIRVFNIVLGTLSLWLIFGCAKVLFENDAVGLWGVLIYILTPWAYRYTGILFGLPTLVHFLSLLSLLTILLAFKHHNIALHLLALGSLLVLNQTKMEYFLYYFIYLAVFCALKEYKNFSKKQIILFGIMAMILLVPPIIKANLFKSSFSGNPGWCGFPAQTFGHAYTNNAIVLGVDNVLRKVINSRISLAYFLGDLPVFFKFWWQTNLILPTVLSIVGAFLALKEYPKKKIQNLIPLLFFSSLAIGYLFDCGWYEARHAISAYGFLAIFAGYGLYWLLQTSKTEKWGRVLATGTIICLLTFQAIICSEYLKDYKAEVKMFKSWFNTYSLDRQLFTGLANKNALIITIDNTNRDILHCLGYRAVSFSDSIDTNGKITDGQSSIDSFLNSPDIKKEDAVYFLKSFGCSSFDFFKQFCLALTARAQKIEKEIYLYDEGFKTQVLIIKP
ncbi:MAG: glycosyltransferase family 39 protein [Candidatus Parcubacteria bacterium]|nr:glycosyltransferase family 39 protein [Candidatus Parcubacteria bacterium]